MSFINTLHEVENMNTLCRCRKLVVLLIALYCSLLLRVHHILKSLKMSIRHILVVVVTTGIRDDRFK